MMHILGALDESLYAQYCQYKTSMDLWEAIQITFEDGSTQNILLWVIELFQTKMEDSDPLQLHLDKILNAACKLHQEKPLSPQRCMKCLESVFIGLSMLKSGCSDSYA